MMNTQHMLMLSQQVNRPPSMKKDGIQTRKRKPKGSGSSGSSSKTKSSSVSVSSASHMTQPVQAPADGAGRVDHYYSQFFP